ncbi:MAG: hypothetical protein PHP22_12460, partial [Oscillospiraceae bacterium]|nr:hypothetical protein [Oscillospiraceae bacterium]
RCATASTSELMNAPPSKRTNFRTLELSNFRTLSLHCLDLDEDAPLPVGAAIGAKRYDDYK